MAGAADVPADQKDAPIRAGHMIGIRQQSGAMRAYLSVPQRPVRYNGAVIVAHELWGLTEQIKGVADRLAEQGYLALAPDLFSTDKVNREPSEQLQKELFSDDERTRYLAMPKLRALIAPTQTPQFTLLALSRLASCFEYMYSQPLAHQKVVLLGFGIGGNYVFEMALREPRLCGAVVFYGHAPKVRAELSHIRCPVLAFYGKKETSLFKELDLLTTHMAQAGVNFEAVVYPQTGHAFFNEQNSFAYSQESAADAWRRTLAFAAEQTAAIR